MFRSPGEEGRGDGEGVTAGVTQAATETWSLGWETVLRMSAHAGTEEEEVGERNRESDTSRHGERE